MTHTVRQTPSGSTQMDEGYQSLIAFSLDPDLLFWEESVGAPGFEGGEPIPTWTQHNTKYRTRSPRSLKEVTAFQVTGRFSGSSVDQIFAMINVNQWITVKWPDGTLFSFPGYLKAFVPQQSQEGAPLQGVIQVVPTMQINGVETDYELSGTS